MIKKTSNKSVWSNGFWFVKVCIFLECIQYTINWDKAQMLRKILLDKISDTKDTLFLLSRAPTHHSFTFNLQFLYELKQQVCLSNTVCGTFHFWSRSAFIKVYIFVQNARTILLYKVIIPFKIKIIEKPHAVLLPDLWFLSCIKMFLNSVISAWVKKVTSN